MDKELINKEHNEKMKCYYSLREDCYAFKCKLMALTKHKGHSGAFRVMVAALDVFDDQINNDHQRYIRRVRLIDDKIIIKELQNSLNRERIKRELLEKQIKEATTSSGLFIKYVRDVLGVGTKPK